MDNLFNQKVINANSVFDDCFVDAKSLYLHAFNKLPCRSYIGQLDGEKSFDSVRERFAGQIVHVLRDQWYKASGKQYQFDRTILVMDNQSLIEFGDNYCEIWHDETRTAFVGSITELLSSFRERQKRQPREINLVVQKGANVELKGMEIKRTNLNLGMFYEDDFKELDKIIRRRLNKKNDKGIVLLHGLPGTGKTTYLRYLISRIKKRVLFLSPSMAGRLMNPDFIDLLIDNPNTVLIIEDAENIITDRRHNSSSSVSNLLNISDGLLADFLNVQLVCTFNSPLTMIDPALLRKGRLIAKYEFGKLSKAKAQRLSDHFGFKTVVDKPMTIAEIAGQHEREVVTGRVEVIGFRRQLIEN